MGQKWSSHIWSISGPDKSETLSGPYMAIYGLYIISSYICPILVQARYEFHIWPRYGPDIKSHIWAIYGF